MLKSLKRGFDLFAHFTLESILAIERRLQELKEKKGCEYVAVSAGQKYGVLNQY